jgi:ELWxxDGT repeat protein
LAKVLINDVIYFGVEQPSCCPIPVDFWKSDGTAIGTELVKDIRPFEIYVIEDVLYLSADDGVNGRELWKSDGTMTGTVLITNINPTGSSYPGSLTGIGDILYFSADDGVIGSEL